MDQRLEESSSLSSSSVKGVLIPTDGVDRVWQIAAPLLEKATKRTEKIDIPSLLKCVRDGSMQLWLAYDPKEEGVLAAAATEMVTYTSGLKSARILLLGGLHLSRWEGLIATIEEWALSEGCSTVEMVGRRGWGRVYSDYLPLEHWFSKEIA